MRGSLLLFRSSTLSLPSLEQNILKFSRVIFWRLREKLIMLGLFTLKCIKWILTLITWIIWKLRFTIILIGGLVWRRIIILWKPKPGPDSFIVRTFFLRLFKKRFNILKLCACFAWICFLWICKIRFELLNETQGSLFYYFVSDELAQAAILILDLIAYSWGDGLVQWLILSVRRLRNVKLKVPHFWLCLLLNLLHWFIAVSWHLSRELLSFEWDSDGRFDKLAKNSCLSDKVFETKWKIIE